MTQQYFALTILSWTREPGLLFLRFSNSVAPPFQDNKFNMDTVMPICLPKNKGQPMLKVLSYLNILQIQRHAENSHFRWNGAYGKEACIDHKGHESCWESLDRSWLQFVWLWIILTIGLFRKSCYTDGNGPEVFKQCSTKWIRNSDTSKDEYGD